MALTDSAYTRRMNALLGLLVLAAAAAATWRGLHVDEWRSLNAVCVRLSQGGFANAPHSLFHSCLWLVVDPFAAAGAGVRATVLGARGLSFGFFVGCLALTFRIARHATNPQAGRLAVVLLASTSLFVARGIEIRPAVLQAFLTLLAIDLLLRGLERDSRAMLALSSLSISATYFVVPRAALVLFALLLVTALAVHFGRLSRRWLLAYWGLAFAPIVLVTSWLLGTGSFDLSVSFGWLLDREASFSLWSTGLRFVLLSPLLAALFALGVIKASPNYSVRVIKHLAVLMVVLAFTIPRPHAEYWLVVLPLVAIVGADFGWWLLEKTPGALLAVALLGTVIAALGSSRDEAGLMAPQIIEIERVASGSPGACIAAPFLD